MGGVEQPVKVRSTPAWQQVDANLQDPCDMPYALDGHAVHLATFQTTADRCG
jgi:hypothetical protein